MTQDKRARAATLAELDTTEKALEDLLGTLLAEVPEHVDSPPKPASPVEAKPSQKLETSPETPVSQTVVSETVIAAPVEVEQTPQPEQAAEPCEPALNKTVPAPIQLQEQNEADVVASPDWANTDFKVLLVRIGQMRLAVPLVSLNSIARLSERDEVINVPGQPEWHQGVMRYRDGKLVLSDLGILLNLSLKEASSDYLLVIGDGRFGLLCDAIEEQQTLSAGQVNWRQPGDQRDWMYGMLPEHMCALLNPDAVASRLEAR